MPSVIAVRSPLPVVRIFDPGWAWTPDVAALQIIAANIVILKYETIDLAPDITAAIVRRRPRTIKREVAKSASPLAQSSKITPDARDML